MRLSLEACRARGLRSKAHAIEICSKRRNEYFHSTCSTRREIFAYTCFPDWTTGCSTGCGVSRSFQSPWTVAMDARSKYLKMRLLLPAKVVSNLLLSTVLISRNTSCLGRWLSCMTFVHRRTVSACSYNNAHSKRQGIQQRSS